MQLRLGLTTPAQRQHSIHQINSLRAERSRPRAARARLSILALSVARDRLRCRRQVRAAAQACNFSRLHARGATSVHRHGFRMLICMMRPRGRLRPLTLTRAEQEQLERWVRDCRGRRALAVRARIVLACQAACSNRETAKRLRVTPQTVGKWRTRYLAHGMQGLADRTRTGAPRSISDALVAAVLAKTLHDKPPDAVRWSSRRLGATLGVSQRTVLRIWRTFGL